MEQVVDMVAVQPVGQEVGLELEQVVDMVADLLVGLVVDSEVEQVGELEEATKLVGLVEPTLALELSVEPVVDSHTATTVSRLVGGVTPINQGVSCNYSNKPSVSCSYTNKPRRKLK